jgi:thiamine biosynthesis protein ThiS
MTLQINGESRSFPDGLTVAALIGQLGMKTDRVAVELNLEIVPRSNWDSTHLKNGDKLEIVHFVGGGSADTTQTEERREEGSVLASPARSWLCPTCGMQASGKFCGSCGEKKAGRNDLSLGHLFSHAVEVVFHADSRIIRSFRDLFTRPGFLTAEYVRGRRKPYLQPFQVFFVANVAYFLLLPLTGWNGLKTPLEVQTSTMTYQRLASRLVAQRVAAKGVTTQEFTHSFNHVVEVQARSLVVLMVPMFAVFVWLLELRKSRPFGEHLVFALHFVAVFLLGVLLLCYGLAHLVLLVLGHFHVFFSYPRVDLVTYAITAGLVVCYSFQAFRRTYADNAFAAAVKALILALAPLPVLQAYRFVLFLTALYTA